MKKTVVKTHKDFTNACWEADARPIDWILAPDFDAEVMTGAMNGNDEFKVWGALVQNTWKSMSAKEQKNFINYILDLLRAARAGYGYDKHKVARVLEFMGGVMQNNGEFFKHITPDNQVFVNHTLRVAGYKTKLKYNFSGARLTDKELAWSELVGSKDEQLQKKYNEDLGKVEVKPEELFKGATNPQYLYNMRIGLLSPQSALIRMSQKDMQFIVPSQDFKNLEPDMLYSIMTNSNYSWNGWQVRSMMEMIVDKAPENDTKFLYEAMQIINANGNVFLTENEDNYKLWLKIDQKYGAMIKAGKEDFAQVKARIDEIKANQKQNNNDLNKVKEKFDYIDSELRKWDSYERSADALKKTKVKADAEAVLQEIREFRISGQVTQDLKQPQKTWKIFATSNEKSDYEKICALVNDVKDFQKMSIEKRMELFGKHKFDLWRMYDELYVKKRKLEDLQQEFGDEIYRQESRRLRSNRSEIIASDNIDKQKDAKSKRIDKAREKLKEKGVVLGQKSGVVKVDKIVEIREYERALKKKIDEIRAMPGNKGKSSREIEIIAIKALKNKQM